MNRQEIIERRYRNAVMHLLVVTMDELRPHECDGMNYPELLRFAARALAEEYRAVSGAELPGLDFGE